MGFGLIPVGDGIKIVSAIVCVAVLDGGAKRFGERDRRIEMKAIHRPARTFEFRADDRRAKKGIRKGFAAEIPGAEEIVF